MRVTTLGGPGPGCSLSALRRLAAGELSGPERAGLEAHVAGCARCANGARQLAEEKRALAADVPFGLFAAGVAEKLARPRSRARFARWVSMGAASCLAVAVGGLGMRGIHPAAEPGVRSKGAADAQLYVAVEGSDARLLVPGERLAPGARLRVGLEPGGRRSATVLLVEPGETSLVYAGAATPGPLPGAFEWTGTGEATLLVILGDASIAEPRRIRSGADVPPGSDVVQIALRR